MQESLTQQQFFMQWAITLGEKGRITAPPNPWVGCVIVREKEIIGEGYHQRAGEPHAEIHALNQAGILARGATAFVTLEPCCHQGRTPPCTEALIKAGIKRVVIPFEDPDTKVAGKGVQALKAAGVEVIIGVCAEEAKKSLEPYIYQRQTKKPYCVLKAAASVDGRIAAEDGTSQWITGEEARANVHLLRAESQAVLVGWRTAEIDQPKLTVRGKEAAICTQPLRVVVDAQGKLSPKNSLFQTPGGKVWIFTTKKCPEARQKEWREAGAEVQVVSEENQRVALKSLLETLGQEGIIQLLVEGGSLLQSAFLEQNLAQKLVIYYGGCVLGNTGKALFPTLRVSTITQAPRWNLEGMHRFGNDVRCDYKVSRL